MENNYSKRPLWQWLVIYIIIGGLAYGAIYYFFIAKSNPYTPTSTGQTPSLASQQKFLDSGLAKNAFQIFPGPISAEAKTATSGFVIKTQALPDGSTQVNLTSSNPEYKNQQYTVISGYTLYFIEKTSVDDSPANDTDNNLGDDSAVLVDTQGYQVKP